MKQTVLEIGVLSSLLCGCAHGPFPHELGTLVDRTQRDLPEGVRVYELDLDEAEASAKLDNLIAWSEARGGSFYLWIDVGRSARLADAHPQWIAGMGSHEDWRRLFPNAPKPGPAERIGMYPWVPIWYREVLEDRRTAAVKLLSRVGPASGLKGVFLHHVQGAPSACGCGNAQCRWTVDYRMAGGPERVDGAPAALLIAALKKDLPGVGWIPVWATECEERDLPGDGSTGYCGGVGCFKGLCWKESTKEMEALARETEGPVALLAAGTEFQRDLPAYGGVIGWLGGILREVETIPPANGHAAWPRDRLIAVVACRSRRVEDAAGIEGLTLATGVRSVLLSRKGFEEGWEPRIIPVVSPGKQNPPATGGQHGHD